jgi:hypothetical protein
MTETGMLTGLGALFVLTAAGMQHSGWIAAFG